MGLGSEPSRSGGGRGGGGNGAAAGAAVAAAASGAAVAAALASQSIGRCWLRGGRSHPDTYASRRVEPMELSSVARLVQYVAQRARCV